MALDFNVDPYYDDFDPTKNFHRILFKPGYAVQARELTQSQTILQDQISKFGTGIYADGSKVSGGNIHVDTNITTVKVVGTTTDVATYVNYYAVGQTSNFVARVTKVDSINNYLMTKAINTTNAKLFASGETINLYLSKTDALNSLNATVSPQYTVTALSTNTIIRNSSGTYLSTTLSIATGNISVGDTISITSIGFTATVISITDTANLILNTQLPQDISNLSTTITNEISVRCLEVGIDSGVWFTNGYFVSNYANSIIPDSLNSYPSVVVGFEVDETEIDSTNDPSLLDPAIGASNYQAPGADRYNISLNLVTKPYVSDQTVANLTTVKFIELVRINAGVIEDLNSVPILTDVSAAIAQSVSDTSGDFVVNPFSLNIVDNVSGSNSTSATYVSSISPGKAYIGGYPVQHIAHTPFILEKSRDTNVLTNQDIITYYGNYTTVKNLNGSIINFQTGTTVELHNVVFGTASSATKIGTARVRNFDYDSGSGSSTEFKSFLSDVKLANSSFSNVKSLVIPGGGTDYVNVTFSANTVSSANLIDSNYSTLIFPLPQKNISNVSSVNYSTHRYFNVTPFTNGSYTITTNGTNELFEPGTGTVGSAQRQLYFAVVTTSASGSYTSGQFIPMDQANVSIVIDNSAALPQATINIGGGFNGSATIYATVGVSNDTIMNKALTTNQVVQVSANTINTPLDLGKSDVYAFHSVFELGNTHTYIGTWSSGTTYTANSAVYTPEGNVYISLIGSNTANTPNSSPTAWSVVTNNIASYFTDNGQRDTFYDHGYITNRSGVSKGNVAVVFDYFTHSGGTGLFTVDSYPVNYDIIPSYTSKQSGVTYNLRDVIDFRPRRTDNNTTLDLFQIPSPFTNEFIVANYGYYLARTDKIVLYPNGQFKTIRGTSSYTNPVTPSDVSGTLTAFTLNYAPYTYSKGDIVVTPNNTRRYSMRDIGLLDKRISNIENFTSLSILENQVTGSDVTDSTGLNLLFKNGYLVDGFTGSGVADVANPDYIASIDPVARLLRPSFLSNVASYYVDTTQGTFVTSPGKVNNQLSLKNNLITYSYDEYSLVFQNVATEVINVNPFDVINFAGTAALTPSSDVWYSTENQPNINIVTEDQAAWIAAVNGTGNGSQWNDWQLNWTGQSTDTVVNSSDQASITRDTTAISTALAQGLNSALQGGPIPVSSTTQVLSNAVIPYARSIPVQFQVNGMAPYTRLHTFINGKNVDNYVSPTTTDRLYNLDISNQGSGYVDGNNQSIITITGANTNPAVFTANVYGGKIVSVNLIATGSGYTSTPTITVNGSNTGTAVLVANTSYLLGAPLVSDVNGSATGTLIIPNGVTGAGANVATTLGLSTSNLANNYVFPTGTLLIEWSDNIVTPAISQTYAKSSFYSQGTLQTTQTTVISTRPPQATPKPQIVDTPVAPPPPATSNGGGGGGGGSEYTPTGDQGGTITGQPISDIIVPIMQAGLSIIPSGGNAGAVGVAQFVDAVYDPTTGGGTPLYNAIVSYSNTIAGLPQGSTPPASVVASVGTQIWEKIGAAGIDPSTFTTTNIQNPGVVRDIFSSVINGDIAQQNAPSQVVGGCLSGTDPLSQNFAINAAQYINGVFLSSVDLYFATVDPTIPVSIRIRPTVNGYPDAVNDIPGSIVWKNPSEINVPSPSDITSSIGPTTTFTFDHPVYLAPGLYTIMIAANSNQYQMYASKLGQVQYGTQQVVSQLNYAASLFKSQNASTWVPAPSETLCMNLKICDFAGGTTTFDVTSNTSPSIIDYDLVQLMTNDLSFNSLDSINYKILTKDAASGVQSSPTSIVPHQNFNFTTKQRQSSTGDIIIRPTVTNIDRFTSPVIDLERLNTILVKNVITPYYSANTVSESLGGHYNGGAVARYISRRVTLNNNFDSTGLTVYVDVNRPSGTKIEVYYKVLNSNDANNFDDQPYVLMNPILTPGSGLVITGANDYTEDVYQALNISYHDITNNTLYTNFKYFAIKIVMYSNVSSIVPQIKNFRTIATA
jgi:hypothetical protein